MNTVTMELHVPEWVKKEKGEDDIIRNLLLRLILKWSITKVECYLLKRNMVFYLLNLKKI